MPQIDYHQPEFVRHYLSLSDANPDHVIALNWLQETRLSLRLDSTATCGALLQKPDAFVLHSEQREAHDTANALSPRARLLNQASFDMLTLHPLPADIRLYALGILLSFAEKNPGDSDETLALLATLPEKMREHLQSGALQAQFQQMPSVPALQRKLISGLAEQEFNWDILPESQRKQVLPLQISLLALQDENSEALLQQKLAELWETTASSSFDTQPWMMENYLLYRLYHDVFPCHEHDSAEQRYLLLNADFFMLKSLFSLWVMDGSTLSENEIVALIAMFEQWRHTPAAQDYYQQLLASPPGGALLSAFSLLVR